MYNLLAFSVLGLACEAFAFIPTAIKVNSNVYHKVNGIENTSRSRPFYSITTSQLQSSTDQNGIEEDCGCDTKYTGKPSDMARSSINHRSAIAKIPLYKIDGSITTIDDIIGDANDMNKAQERKTSLVVFLRSLG